MTEPLSAEGRATYPVPLTLFEMVELRLDSTRCLRKPSPFQPIQEPPLNSKPMYSLTRSSSLLASSSRRAFAASVQSRAKHTLPELPYAYDVRPLCRPTCAFHRIDANDPRASLQALEPSISKEIMTRACPSSSERWSSIVKFLEN